MSNIYYVLIEKNWIFNTQEIECNFIDWKDFNIEAKAKAEWIFHWLFWRKDFCDIWVDFYNNKITREEMNILFDNIIK